VKSWLVPQRGGRKSFSQAPFWELDAYRAGLFSQGSTRNAERIENDFEGYAAQAYKANGIVFGCIDRRVQVFSQARFQWRRYRQGQPQELFGTPELRLLERPWPNGTTGELLSLMEIDNSLAGNFYATTADSRGRIGRNSSGPTRRIVRMRPDWVTLIIDAPSGDPYGLDARVVGYEYEPKTDSGRRDPVLLLPEEVCHYSPKPDPIARFRGMSWLSPVIDEVAADKATTRHKRKVFQNGAVPMMALKFDKDVRREDFLTFVREFNSSHQGVDQWYKTLFLANGADPKPLSFDFKALDMKSLQGAGETRLAVAAGVPAAILGISEGLAGSTLNAGNFGAARRLFVDTTQQDLWRKAAPSLRNLVTPPGDDVELEIDPRHIPFLREDAKDDAEIRRLEAEALARAFAAGFDGVDGMNAVIEWLRTGDLARLTGKHSGVQSVQTQTTNGNGSRNGAQIAVSR
jgi:phage portal protein BeeE